MYNKASYYYVFVIQSLSRVCLGLRSKSHRISCPVSISAVDKVHAWEILSNSSGFSFVCKVVADLFTKSFRQTNQTKSRRLSCVFLIKLLSSNEISTGCFLFFSFFFFAGKIQVLKILLIIMPKILYSFKYHYKSRN